MKTLKNQSTETIMNYHWNEDTINHFRFESNYDSYANIKEQVKEFVEINCSLESGETEEMLVEDLLNQIYNTTDFRNERQLIILEKLINNFYVKAHCEETWEDLDLTDEQNAIFEHLLYNMNYNCERNEEMSDYMLRATYKEAANYYLEVFLPKFKFKK